jgi:hypothetical protein
MSPLRFALLAAVVFAAACTGTTPTTSASVTATPSLALPPRVTVDGRIFDVSCTPVAEAVVDVKLRHDPGQPVTRAITGLWNHQAVAVLANDRSHCGVWALAVAQDVSAQAADQIRREVAQGVADFGVTASPVPRDAGSG